MARQGLTAERLAKVGAELADEIGFDQLTVSAVARQVGVQPASVYAHLSGTGDLRARVALLALEELADLVSEALAGRAGIDALVAYADAYRDYARAHPGRWAAMQTPLDPATAARSAGPRIAAMTRAVLRGYDLAGEDQTHAVRLIGSSLRGFIDLEAAGSFDHSGPAPAVSWRHTLVALDTLLRAWPPRAEHDHGQPTLEGR
ncbi:TetR family transcriptional regulator [Actinotalea ferrariae CF5-4]|uniref:TetR family transcriptional regulator n=1 Tax=Actinotalea ferrariae CF5-4 TaxID=948458 RepID=A0A021VYD4_9CELL|nr:TetR/AcrR family transcriptional regulator [Actinotalea ferrariae]EYR64077.1 TetR family transcriptional regulator [Actinotalea ferrariae CF5-4]